MPEKHASNEQIKKEWAAQASSKEIAEMTDAAKNGVGHNSALKLNPDLTKDFEYLVKLTEDNKAINAEKRHKISTMKEQYGLPAGAIRELLREIQMDQATLAQKEQAKADGRVMLGIDLFSWQERVEIAGANTEDPLEAAKAESESTKKIKAVK